MGALTVRRPKEASMGRGVAQELRTARDTSARTTKRGEGCDMTVMATTLLGEAGKADAVACTEIRRHGA
ncbi:MAG: hypothetical protein IAE78_02425 [Myxococcus sp.]|nr:hypothetical protein [Myxococcus sp.]